MNHNGGHGVNTKRTEWATPETALAVDILERMHGLRRSVFAVADLYATRPGLCEATRGHYPPRFAWWLERWVRDGVAKWKKPRNNATPVQSARRELVAAALARVDWDTLADHYTECAAQERAEREREDGTARRRAVAVEEGTS